MGHQSEMRIPVKECQAGRRKAPSQTMLLKFYLSLIHLGFDRFDRIAHEQGQIVHPNEKASYELKEELLDPGRYRLNGGLL